MVPKKHEMNIIVNYLKLIRIIGTQTGKRPIGVDLNDLKEAVVNAMSWIGWALDRNY